MSDEAQVVAWSRGLLHRPEETTMTTQLRAKLFEAVVLLEYFEWKAKPSTPHEKGTRYLRMIKADGARGAAKKLMRPQHRRGAMARLRNRVHHAGPPVPAVVHEGGSERGEAAHGWAGLTRVRRTLTMQVFGFGSGTCSCQHRRQVPFQLHSQRLALGREHYRLHDGAQSQRVTRGKASSEELLERNPLW